MTAISPWRLLPTAHLLHNQRVTHPQEQAPRCAHCGRPVGPTLHTRDSWRVDCYLLHTGEVEPAHYRRDEESGPIEYLRLVRPELVVTCADCYALPEVRAARLFPEERPP